MAKGVASTINVKLSKLNSKHQEYKSRWNDLSDFLNKWYYKPDLEALRIALSCYVSHTYIQENPIWLFVIGSPSSGKTSVVLNSLACLQGTYPITELSTNCFISGFNSGMGILPRLSRENNGNGVLLFPDFTTFLQKRPDDRAAIVGQMRRIYDGAFEKEVGNKKQALTWNGKVSVVAACTPDIEEYWALNRSLGERFMYIRWPSGDPYEMGLVGLEQINNDRSIIKGQIKRVKLFVDQSNLDAIDTNGMDFESTGLLHLGVLISKLRVSVKRDILGSKRPIISVDNPESPVRIVKSLGLLARGHATLFRKDEIDNDDLELSRRLGRDTLPPMRAKVIRSLFKASEHELKFQQLMAKIDIPRATLNRLLEDLEAMKAISHYYIGEVPDVEKVFQLTPEYQTLVQQSRIW